MRKGYGPTGVSFHYPFEHFAADCAERQTKGGNLWVEVVIDGYTFGAQFNPDMTESEMRVLFNKIDNVQLGDGMLRYQVFAS